MTRKLANFKKKNFKLFLFHFKYFKQKNLTFLNKNK